MVVRMENTPLRKRPGRNRNRHYNVENTGVTGSYPNLRINVALQRDNQCSQHCGESALLARKSALWQRCGVVNIDALVIKRTDRPYGL